MDRRNFIGKTFLSAVFVRVAIAGLGVTGMAVSCNSNVFTNIANWIPVAEAAISSILAVLTSNNILIAPAVQTIVNAVFAGLAALLAAIKEYQSTTPPPVGTLAKIEAIFHDIVDNFSTFLKSLNLPNMGLFNVISGIVQVVLSTIAAFINQLTQPAAGRYHKVIGDTVSIGNRSIAIVPKARNNGQFRHDVNSNLDAGKADGVNIPQVAYL
jgi:hypothetical protein